MEQPFPRVKKKYFNWRIQKLGRKLPTFSRPGRTGFVDDGGVTNG